MSDLAVAVIGFGKMGLLHGGLANALPGCRLAAVADEASGVLDAFRRLKPAVAVYKDYVRMLDAERPQAIFITSPTHLHVPMARECVERGIPFFVEKPLAPTGPEAWPLVRALEGRPVTNMVGFMTRRADTFVKAREIVEAGALGKLIHLKATMYVAQLFQAGKGWRYDRKVSGGGVLITQNSHLIDLLLWLFGPVSWVSGHTRSWYSETVDDFAHAYLAFDSGLAGYIDTSWSMRHYRTVEISIEVQGENGSLAVSDDAVSLFLDETRTGFAAGWTRWTKPELFRGVPVDIGGPEYARQDAEFLAAVSAGRAVAPDAASAYRVQQVIDAIYRSAERSGSPVAPSEAA